MKNIKENDTLNLKCYIVQNNKIIEFNNQRERSKYLKRKMHTLNGIISISKTPYEIGITEFGNIVNGEYIKQDIKVIEPPKVYFVTKNRRRYYGNTLKQLASKIDVNYTLVLQWFNGKAPVDVKFKISKIGYIEGRKTTFLSFDTAGVQYYVIIGDKTFIYNNLAALSKKLKLSTDHVSKLLCGVRSTNKCSEIGYYINGEFIKSEKKIQNDYKKYADKIKLKKRQIRAEDDLRMLKEIKLKDIREFINIPLYKEDRDLMAAKLDIKNNNGKAVKWTKIKKLLIESGLYEIEYKAQVRNKERKDCVIINIKE